MLTVISNRNVILVSIAASGGGTIQYNTILYVNYIFRPEFKMNCGEASSTSNSATVSLSEIMPEPSNFSLSDMNNSRYVDS